MKNLQRNMWNHHRAILERIIISVWMDYFVAFIGFLPLGDYNEWIGFVFFACLSPAIYSFIQYNNI